MTRTGWTWVCLTVCLAAMATAQDYEVVGCHGDPGQLNLACPAYTHIVVTTIRSVFNKTAANNSGCDFLQIEHTPSYPPGAFKRCSVHDSKQLTTLRMACKKQTRCLTQHNITNCDANGWVSTHFIVVYTCQDKRATGQGTTYSSQTTSDSDQDLNQSDNTTVYLVAGPLAGVVVIVLVVLLVCFWRQKKKKNEVKQGQAGLDTLARVKTNKDTNAYHSRTDDNPYESMPAAVWDIPAYTVICTESGKPHRDSGCDSLPDPAELTVVDNSGYRSYDDTAEELTVVDNIGYRSYDDTTEELTVVDNSGYRSYDDITEELTIVDNADYKSYSEDSPVDEKVSVVAEEPEEQDAVKYETEEPGEQDAVKYEAGEPGEQDAVKYEAEEPGEQDAVKYEAEQPGEQDAVKYEADEAGEQDAVKYEE